MYRCNDIDLWYYHNMDNEIKELYFEDVVQIVGDIFYYALGDFCMSPDLFTTMFINSHTFKMIEIFNPYYAGGRSGVEIAMDVLRKTFVDATLPMPSYQEYKNRFFWAGWALAQFQMYCDVPYKEIVRRISIKEIISMYDIFHEMDISRFIESMDRKFKERNKDTKLKILRVNAGLSQRELAEKSGVSLRLIQLYEQRANDINKGQFETICLLSRALKCDVADLYEW